MLFHLKYMNLQEYKHPQRHLYSGMMDVAVQLCFKIFCLLEKYKKVIQSQMESCGVELFSFKAIRPPILKLIFHLSLWERGRTEC